jgi:NAD(P)H-dependent FMN reductase
MKVLAISGSARAPSTNTAVLRGLARAAPKGMAIEVFAGVGGLPVFSPDLEGGLTPAPVRAFAAQVSKADALIVSCPEYVRDLPGGFKNAIDWLVSRDEIVAKPVTLVHASHRGDDALESLRRVLGTVTSRFGQAPFLRLPVMKLSPEEIATFLERPDIRAEAARYLDDLRAFVTGGA